MTIDLYLGEASVGEYITEEYLQKKLVEYDTLTEEELVEKSNEYGFDIEEFAEYLTGLNLDEYADGSCDVLKEVYDEQFMNGGDMESLFDYLARAPRGNGYQRYFTFYRAMNASLDRETCEKQWEEDNRDMLTNWIESGELEDWAAM